MKTFNYTYNDLMETLHNDRDLYILFDEAWDNEWMACDIDDAEENIYYLLTNICITPDEVDALEKRLIDCDWEQAIKEWTYDKETLLKEWQRENAWELWHCQDLL